MCLCRFKQLASAAETPRRHVSRPERRSGVFLDASDDDDVANEEDGLLAAPTGARFDTRRRPLSDDEQRFRQHEEEERFLDALPPRTRNNGDGGGGTPRARRVVFAAEAPALEETGAVFVQPFLAADVARDLKQHVDDHSYLHQLSWYDDPSDKFFSQRVRFLGVNGRKPSSPRTVARLLTHRRAWERLVALQDKVDYGLIFEPDAVFAPPRAVLEAAESTGAASQLSFGAAGRADADQISADSTETHAKNHHAYLNHVLLRTRAVDPDFEVLNLGRCWDFCDKDQEVARISRSQSLVRSMAPGCTHAYIVSREGAKRLLEWSLPYTLPVDYLMQLLTRRGELRLYSASPPFFVQNETLRDANDAAPECEEHVAPAVAQLLRSAKVVRRYDRRVLGEIRDSWISTWVRDAFRDDVASIALPERPTTQCDALEAHCEWFRGTRTEGDEERRFVEALDALGLDTFLVWGLSMREGHTHRFIHAALRAAAARAFHAADDKPRRVCWIPSGTTLCASANIENALVFASPKHMTYTADPGMKTLPASNANNRYVFHELIPPHFRDLATRRRVVQWVIRGPDGSSPVHEAEHYELKQATASCREVTCFIGNVYVAPWATRYRPIPWHKSPAPKDDKVVHFVGSIWWLNKDAFCDLVEGCAEEGITVVRHGMAPLPKDLCKGRPRATFKNDWRSVSDADTVRYQWDSLFVPVFQGAAHLDGNNSYISDRTFDTVARGMRVITNNPLSARLLGIPFAEARDMCRANARSPVPFADPLKVASHTYLSRLLDILQYYRRD